MTAAAPIAPTTLNGHRVTGAKVYLPAWGLWWADVSLDEVAPLTGGVTLAAPGLSLSGTIMSGGEGPIGRSSFRIAGGKGGWGKVIGPKSYANDAGVKAVTPLIDAALACGEVLDPASLTALTTRLGPAWVRDEAPAARTLERIAPAGWYVGEDGITRIGSRAAATYTGTAQTLATDHARGSVTLAPESLETLVPGVAVAGIKAVDVVHDIAAGAIRTTIYGAGVSSTSRRMAAWRRIFDQLDPDRKFRGVYEYRIVTQRGERLDLQPVRVSTGMPDLQLVPVRPGVPGAKAQHHLGSLVLVAFVDATAARPVVVGFADADSGDFVATLLYLGGATGALAAARMTDPVQAGPFTGTITGPCSTKVQVA